MTDYKTEVRNKLIHFVLKPFFTYGLIFARGALHTDMEYVRKHGYEQKLVQDLDQVADKVIARFSEMLKEVNSLHGDYMDHSTEKLKMIKDLVLPIADIETVVFPGLWKIILEELKAKELI
jgi:hypothetical protein